jgi:hypothetical protein
MGMGKINQSYKSDPLAKPAAQGWNEHSRKESFKIRLAIAGALFSLACVAGYWIYIQNSKKPTAPLTTQQKAEEMARQAREDPMGALGDRTNKQPPRALADNPAPLNLVSPSTMPSRGGVIAPPPPPLKKVVPKVAPVTAPSAEMMATEEKRLGKPILAVDATGMATLPDGRRVAIIGAKPAVTPTLPAQGSSGQGAGNPAPVVAPVPPAP